jgi:hypothetical protein
LNQTLPPGWEPGNSLGFLPFQRHHHSVVTKRGPPQIAPRSEVFATLQRVL